MLEKVGKLLSHWNTPTYTMHGIQNELRDPSNYDTIVRVVSPADRFATAALMFCHFNNVLQSRVCLAVIFGSEKTHYFQIAVFWNNVHPSNGVCYSQDSR